MSKLPEHVRSAARKRTQATREATARALVEVLTESDTSYAQLARLLGIGEALVLRWCSGAVAVPAYLLFDERLPFGLRERLAQRLLGTAKSLGRPSKMHVMHVAAHAMVALTADNDNARPAVAELHDELGRWLCAKEAA